MSSATFVLALIGAVALVTVCWCGYHVQRELVRRRRVAVVRTQLVHRPTVAELREKCSADAMPRYPLANFHTLLVDNEASPDSMSTRSDLGAIA